MNYIIALLFLLSLFPIGTTDSRFPVQNSKTFNSITFETQMKMQYTHPCPPVWLRELNSDINNYWKNNNCISEYDFSASDARVSWAKQNGYQVWGHTLVWAYQHSGWLNIPLPPAWKERVLLDHIKTQVTHFCGDVSGWDVINEYWDTGLGIWADIPDVVFKSFKEAEKALLDCKASSVALYFNNGAACYDNLESTNTIIPFLDSLRKRGARIDGLAEQCHYRVTKSNLPNKDLMIQVQNKYADSGYETRFSEVDLQIFENATEQDQALAVKSIIGSCQASKKCKGVTFWGQDDGSSWINFLGSVQNVNALLFDKNLNPKPSYYALQEQLKVETVAPIQATTVAPTQATKTVFNGKNTWVDFFPEVGKTSVKNYDIINGVAGHVQRVTREGEFKGARIIEYIKNGTIFEGERWTQEKDGTIVHHNYGSPNLRPDRNKYLYPNRIPVGTGAPYPSLIQGSQSAQVLAYGADGLPEYTTIIEMNSSVEYMRSILSPISSSEKMLLECFRDAIACHHVSQIYHFKDHIGVEDVIYINGMPYSNNLGSDEFSRFYRNGELAWSRYRILGNPANFPSPTSKEYVDVMREAARKGAFKGEYYIYDGKYSINGVNYTDFLAD